MTTYNNRRLFPSVLPFLSALSFLFAYSPLFLPIVLSPLPRHFSHPLHLRVGFSPIVSVRRCVGVSSRRDPTKRTPLPRASLTIRRDCRKIRDTRKSISTAVGSDGVSRKSHCIGAPTRGRKTDASFLLSRARGGTREESRAYICNSVERANFLWLRIGC